MIDLQINDYLVNGLLNILGRCIELVISHTRGMGATYIHPIDQRANALVHREVSPSRPHIRRELSSNPIHGLIRSSAHPATVPTTVRQLQGAR